MLYALALWDREITLHFAFNMVVWSFWTGSK